MQPYFLPYIGYFQLLGAVDTFVVYDNIQYTKKGWINRNRMLGNGGDALFSLPLASGSDYLDVRDRELAAEFRPDKLQARFTGAYRRAPQYGQTLPMLQAILNYPERNLFCYIHHALSQTATHLGVNTEIVISSTVDIDHSLRGADKVVALCKALGAQTYINSIGGLDLYSREAFASEGLELQFLRSLPLEYSQVSEPFLPALSIVDVLMHNPVDTVRGWVRDHYELV